MRFRPQPPKSPPYIIWWAIAVHLAWGFALISDPAALPLVVLVGLHWFAAFGITGVTLGETLVIAALLAIVPLVFGRRMSSQVALTMLLPQYALLLTAFFSDVETIISGVFVGASGNAVAVDRIILFIALWPMVIAAVLHTAAILERHVFWIRHSS